jgi:integrase
MPRTTLTDRFCVKARARDGESQTDYFDATVAGLSLRVSASRKAWSYLFTDNETKRRARMTLGTYPATSLAAARGRANEVRGSLEAGKNPRAKPDTFRAICEEWFAREGAKLRSSGPRKAALERLIYPVLGNRPIADIRRSDIVRAFDGIEDASGPVMADRTLAYVRKVMNWHAARSDDFRSPIVPDMARTKPKERERSRTLSDEELRAVWAASAEGVFGHFVRFILLTCARRNEAADMTWGEIAEGYWTLPAARNKTKAELVRPLSGAALAALPPKGEVGPFIFSTDGGGRPISGFSKLKARIDRAACVQDWTLHDLRRTARTLMSRAGVTSDHAERCLGHAIGGVRGVYDRHRYAAEMARAYEALAAQIDRIVDPRDNVVQLKAP